MKDFIDQSPPKLGIPRQDLIESPRIPNHIKVHFNAKLHTLSESGWTFLDPVDVARAAEIVQMDPMEHLDVLTDSFREDLEEYLGTLIEVPTGVRTLEDVINFNDQHSVSGSGPQRHWLISRLKSSHLVNAVSSHSSKLFKLLVGIQTTIAQPLSGYELRHVKL
jgi:hypothetical protein